MGVQITKAESSKKIAAEKPKMTFIQKVIKNDTYMVLADSAVEIEDEFVGLYFTSNDLSKVFLEPPFCPKTLQRMTSLNNTLSQCVDAMEVNIDGTGHDFVPVDSTQKVDAKEEQVLRSFFDEPFPGKSFTTIRRLLRRDLEAVGWGFLEVLRNAGGEVIAVRNVLTAIHRMVKLDAPVIVKKTVNRNGQDIEIEMYDRERRYAQKILNTITYFRDFGSTRQLNKETGEWETPDKPVPFEKRASELLMFTVNPDSDSMYGLPRWINNMPSVIGSRKAEEQNLEFFDAGGVPPAIIFVQGGTLAKDMTDQLKMYLSGQMKSKNRAVVVEATSTSGSIDGSGSAVQVKVERFGAESTKDAMYAQYDKDSYERVRTAFRLPPLFLGKAADYNFATAKTAYMVAEAQVFQPERQEFDEIINKTLVKALGVKNTKFKSNPITMKDVEQQLAAIEVIQQYVKKDELVQEVGKIAGVSLEFDAEAAQIDQKTKLFSAGLDEKGQPLPPPPPTVPAVPPGKSATTPASTQPPQNPAKKPVKAANVQKSEAVQHAQELIRIAHDYAVAKGYLVTKFEMAPSDKEQAIEAVHALDVDERETVFELVSSMSLNDVDPELLSVFHDHEH